MSLLENCLVLLWLSFQTLAGIVKTTSPLQPLQLVLFRDRDSGSCTFRSLTHTQPHRSLSTLNDVVINSQLLSMELPNSITPQVASEKFELIGHVSDKLWSKARTICTQISTDVSAIAMADQHVLSPPHRNETTTSKLEIHPLMVSGSPINRVDLTFFSDGYTADQKDKFLADAKRLTFDMSQNQTFAAVRPLMNFWAAFVPSHESGIGVGGTPKDTAFGLYRDATELRAVYCSKEDVARDACLSLGNQCDYPILLGNDGLYGGLGGEFTISTASELNGALVLRHELGHSIIGVGAGMIGLLAGTTLIPTKGEEYDGGYAYFGVNAARNVSQNTPFPWSHWLSPSSMASQGVPRTERAVMDFQAYPWTMLNKTSPWSATFTSSGLYARFLVRFSLAGLPEKEDLIVKLDGKDLGWVPRPDVKLDRWHYDINYEEPLEHGEHELSFTLGKNAIEGKAQLCSAEILEYGDENEFNSTVGYYGAFPTFSNINATTFRPTNELCLMRRVTSPNFCNVCLEGLWISLLKRVSLIEEFTITTSNTNGTALHLTLVPFGQFRGSIAHRFAGEVYTIAWKWNGDELPGFANLTEVLVKGDARGQWQADVQLHTLEVRADLDGLLKQSATVEITDKMVQRPVIKS